MLNKDTEKAQDFVQDIFLKLMEKKHLFDPSKKFYTWIFTIAGNMCKTEYRNPYKISISADEYEISDAVFQENLAEKDLFNLLLEKSLNGLENHHKETFVLRFMEHLSLQEIAEITGTSLGTVKSRLFYATQKMAKELKDYNPKIETTFFN
jgi:RNA polymerase sigma-70 factor (ECF subfamily)